MCPHTCVQLHPLFSCLEYFAQVVDECFRGALASLAVLEGERPQRPSVFLASLKVCTHTTTTTTTTAAAAAAADDDDNNNNSICVSF